MSEPNWEMLARVRDRIAEVGNKHCDMWTWSTGEVRCDGAPVCGSTACVAGWTLALALGEFMDGPKWQPRVIRETAREALGLVPWSPCSTYDLFDLDEWPDDYRHTAHDEGHAKGMLAILDDILDRKIDPNTLQPI